MRRRWAALALCLIGSGCVDTRPPASLLGCSPIGCEDGGRPTAADAPAALEAPAPEAPAPEAPTRDREGPAQPDAPPARPEVSPPEVSPAETPRGEGAPCAIPGDCRSGFCVDGVCCRTACTQRCHACAAANAPGVCTPVAAGQDPDDDCAVEPASSCGRDGTCDGAGACRLQPAGTVCQPPRCESGVAAQARTCDGRGTCQAAPTTGCAPFGCADTGCADACAADRECAVNHFCARPRCASLLAGLVGYWKLDELRGTTAADSSGAGASGILLDGPTWIAAGFPGATFPNAGALSFDGLQARVEIPHRSAYGFAADQSYTLAAWARTPTPRTGIYRTVVAKSRDVFPHYGIWLSDGSRWVCGAHDGVAIANLVGTTAPAADRWTHVACVQDGAGGRRRLYVDGVEEGTGTAHAASGPGPLWIGAARSVDEGWPGAVDDVRLYARALGPAEIAALAAGR